jgi:hypothetical protein
LPSHTPSAPSTPTTIPTSVPPTGTPIPPSYTPTPSYVPLGFQFTSTPLDINNLDQSRNGEAYGYYNGVQGFGNTKYAYDTTNSPDIPNEHKPYIETGGLHNGIDFAAPVGTPVYSNINISARVKVVREGLPNGIPDANPKVILEFDYQEGKVWIIYGHINATIADGTVIQAGERKQLGTLADHDDYRGYPDSHLHLGVTNYGDYWSGKLTRPTYFNPLLYFASGVLPNDLFEGQKYAQGTSTSLTDFTIP